MAELFVPIPEASMVSGTVEKEPFEFSSDHYIAYKHNGVGSGTLLSVQFETNVFIIKYNYLSLSSLHNGIILYCLPVLLIFSKCC